MSDFQTKSIGITLATSAIVVIAMACNGEGSDTVETIDLGTVTLSDTGGFSGDLAVELPENTTSAMVFCGGFGDDALGAVWTVKDADGAVAYSGDDGPVNWRSDFLDDMAPAVLPLSPALPATPGTWNFDWFIGAGNGGTLNCGGVIRSGLGNEVPDTQRIAMELVFVGLSDLDAAGAPDDPDLQAALDTFTSQWATGGLEVDITYKDFAGDATRFTVVDVEDDDTREFNDLLRTADPDEPNAITVFMVEEVVNNSAGGATILGLSAGPPGAATLAGTSKSGMVVSTIDLRDAPDDIGRILAHEGGHFLGLFHTTERDGSQTDLLGDTPECANDANGDDTLDNTECAGSGTDNVMWWTLTSGNASLSADQGWVVRRNPAAF